MANDKFMTLDEVAKYLDVSVCKIRVWKREKGFPSIRLGHRTVRFDRAEVDRWVRDQATDCSQPAAAAQ